MMAAMKPQAYGYPLYELLEGFVGTMASIERDLEVMGLAIDSRKVEPGYLFLACHGTQQHGLSHAAEAVANGAAAVAYETPAERDGNTRELVDVLVEQGIPVFCVDDLSDKAGFIADRFFSRPSSTMQVVGITGTNGKTSCSHFLAQLFAAKNRVAVMGTIGNGMYGDLQTATHTTPDAVSVHEFIAAMLEQGADEVVMEVSSHGLEQGRVNGVSFDAAVFTNLSREHLDYHGDMMSYGLSKQKLFGMPGLRYAVINADDEFGRALLANMPDRVQSVCYSLSDETNADAAVIRSSVMHLGCVQGSDLQFSDEGLSMQVTSPWGDTVVSSPLFGRFNAANILAVLATALVQGHRLVDVVAGISTLESVPGRMEKLGSSAKQPAVIIDYAHTPDALEQVLRAARAHCQGKVWCVFGCGGDRDTGKRPLMGRHADELADEIILTDDNPRSEPADEIIRQVRSGIKREQHLHIEQDRAAAIEYAIRHASKGDVVLIAGKGHEDYQLVGDRRLPFSDIETARRVLGGQA